eukprot:403362841
MLAQSLATSFQDFDFSNPNLIDYIGSQLEEGVGKFSLQALPSTAKITESRFSGISTNQLLYFRLINFGIDFFFSAQAMSMSGIVRCAMFISCWANFVSQGTHLLLIYSHFRDYDFYYDSLVKAIFQIALPLNFLTFWGYWSFLYNRGWPLDMSDPYVKQMVYMHGPSFFALTAEMFMNSMTFDIATSQWRMLWTTLSYMPILIFCYDIAGAYQYGDLDFTTLEGWFNLIKVVPFGMFSYYVMAYLWNWIKGGVEAVPRLADLTQIMETFTQIQGLV